jgi:hypothetical protein
VVQPSMQPLSPYCQQCSPCAPTALCTGCNHQRQQQCPSHLLALRNACACRLQLLPGRCNQGALLQLFCKAIPRQRLGRQLLGIPGLHQPGQQWLTCGVLGSVAQALLHSACPAQYTALTGWRAPDSSGASAPQAPALLHVLRMQHAGQGDVKLNSVMILQLSCLVLRCAGTCVLLHQQLVYAKGMPRL